MNKDTVLVIFIDIFWGWGRVYVLVKYLPHKHEDLNSDPQPPYKNWRMSVTECGVRLKCSDPWISLTSQCNQTSEFHAHSERSCFKN